MGRYRDWLTPTHVEKNHLRCWDDEDGRPRDFKGAVVRCETTNKLFLTPEFEAWTQNPDHWTFTPGIEQAFPEAKWYGLQVRKQ